MGMREEGHLPCPQSWVFKMVSDFSRRLPAGKMSAWVPNHGFLSGSFLVTRIPCAQPSDIVKLEAVDMLRLEGYAYENLAVMSTDPSQQCSPASRMNGGDYDGDEVLVIGLPSIVDAVVDPDMRQAPADG